VTPRRERQLFFAAALALWALYLVQAVLAPLFLDDWFQVRYWRDHDFGPGALWTYARHNYFHYNPRLGEVFLGAIHASPVIHWIVTPLVQVALLPVVFAIAFGRWPRPSLRDLQLLLFVQVMIWLVVPIPGVMYFYRPYTTNYLFGAAITLALFVPYRLGVAGRWWQVPAMLVLGWAAGMCNEHTGPAAIVAIAAFVGIAWRRRRLRAWMVAGMIGLGIGYAMLIFAPGQSVRYGGFAARYSPVELVAARGVFGCADIVLDFVHGAALGLLLFSGALASHVFRHRALEVPRATLVLAVAALAIVVTLFASPTAMDRVFFAPGVLLVAALAACVAQVLDATDVRRLVVGACLVLAGYHTARFVHTSVGLASEYAERRALLAATPPGTVAVVPPYEHPARSRWHFGDDLAMYPWLRAYVGGLYDLAGIDVDRLAQSARVARLAQSARPRSPHAEAPLTYRMLQAGAVPRPGTAIRAGDLAFADPRPVFVFDGGLVDGRPGDHAIRVRRSTLPPRLEATYVLGCGATRRVEGHADGDALVLPVDERSCRGPFTAIACEPDRCWIAGWY
jgi:hypothetical protein